MHASNNIWNQHINNEHSMLTTIFLGWIHKHELLTVLYAKAQQIPCPHIRVNNAICTLTRKAAMKLKQCQDIANTVIKQLP